MSRTPPVQSTAKLRDAELAEAERKLQRAREQLEAVRAEIGRSCQLLDEISSGSQTPDANGPSYLFQGVAAPLRRAKPRREGMHR